jgi:hypothetical protein
MRPPSPQPSPSAGGGGKGSEASVTPLSLLRERDRVRARLGSLLFFGSLFVGCQPSAHALGRRPEDVPVYESQPESSRFTSPANPNPAYTAPRFDNSSASAPAAEPESPAETSKTTSPLPSHRGQTVTSPSTPSSPAPKADTPAYKPLPPAPPLQPDASEPLLPEDLINQH